MMNIPIQITVRDFELPEAARTAIQEKVEKLDTFYEKIMSCRVVVETPHRRQQKGVLYNVRIDMGIPGADLVVKREPHEDLYVAIREAFDAARRQLQDHAHRQRGEVKFHEEVPRARVSVVFPEAGYGFLETPDGREFYFHQNSVLNNKFKALKPGMEVRFVEGQGEKGPQASTVELV
jgi:ribosomal subunit interface protein